MFLKSLHIHGFKSFADPTKIDFHQGVTAIVGPNGCGKSNVLDSVRWVLGEQSAKALRGGQMQDVIFNGSESRKPLGMAEVSLTFGDCEGILQTEFNEVTITRRLFRDGVSEYEINKQPCRLKDIQQTFMDTGIGRTSYSIMEQGKIDMILSARPEDRRAIFEEAAGITRYKNQRKEALRKLEHSEANLTILDTQIQEVKRQLGSLQRQAAKARRYKELLDDLRGLELKFGKHQFDQLKTEIIGFAEQFSALQGAQSGLEQSIEAQEGEVQQLRFDLQTVDEEILRLRETQNEARVTQERSQQRIESNETRIGEYELMAEEAEREIASIEEKIHVQASTIADLEQQLIEMQARLQGTETSCLEKDEEARTAHQQRLSLEQTRGEKREQSGSITEGLHELRNQFAALELQQRNFLFRVENLRTEQDLLAQRRAEADGRRQEVAQSLQLSEEQLQQHRNRRAEIQEQIQSLSSELKETQASYDTAKREHQTHLAQKEALEKLVRNHAGVPAGTQELLDQSSSLGVEILGILADHVQVQAGDEKAVALLFGESASALLLRGSSDAKRLIEALRSGENRPATIALLEAARVSPTTNLHESTHARNSLLVDEVATPFVAAYLENAFIVNTLDEAFELKGRLPEATIATRTGELLTPAGLVRVGLPEGGAMDTFLRHNEIRTLEVSLQSSGQTAETLRAQAETIQSRHQTLQTEYQEVHAATHLQEIEVAKFKHTLETVVDSISQVERHQQTLTADLNRLIAQDQADQERQSALALRVEEEQTRANTIEEEIRQVEAEMDEKVVIESRIRQELSELRVQLATQQQIRDHTVSQKEQHLHRQGELQESLVQRRTTVEEHRSRILRSREEIEAAQVELDQARESAQQMESALQEKNQNKAQQQTLIDERELVLKNQRRELSDLQGRRSGIEVALSQRQMLLGNLRERIERHYQLTLENLPELPEGEETPEWASIETEVNEKRTRLDAMGPVNLDSIQEFEDLEKHHLNLETQFNDLRNSKDQLIEAIAKINLTTKELFSQTFEKVKVNFQQIFSELFGGGTARLELQDENDPLECGIDVIAKPPGKQPQQISLLSGGEKTMTAVALLFAIYQVKPSPFCILDEMDAPLDESNVTRFIKMLQRFLEHSQFVVITHNRRTISMADALYGVTMEERGCSKLLSYQLNKHSNQEPTVSEGNRPSDEPTGRERREESKESLAMSANPVVQTPPASGPDQN